MGILEDTDCPVEIEPKLPDNKVAVNDKGCPVEVETSDVGLLLDDGSITELLDSIMPGLLALAED